MRLRRLTIDELTIEDERSFGHVGLYDELKRVLRRDRVGFLVPESGAPDATWNRVLFLNLTFWSASEPTELLVDAHVAADVVMHAAWHHLVRRALARGDAASRPSADALFLGEAIASAFDLYLVGRLLGHAPDSDFLQTQVPAMAGAAEDAGMDEEAFERMLEGIAAAPDRAFEDLRAMLFDAVNALVACRDIHEAARVMEPFGARRFGALVHHYELSNWILYARAYAGPPTNDPIARGIDTALRAEASAGRSGLDWLEKSWLEGGGSA